ncbi:cytochrome-c oxidase, cbb3-type subunit III [Viridibacterium curvum]|uniref:Cbb3-type cytochrome c oxidase subunit n=1 Tax=Viridibacterium curvum TaxID=1101404 RepID=A0ABP9Q952_9RHOO
MSDFVSSFWHYYVLGLVILSLLYCGWVLVSNMSRRKPGPVELHDHVWDEDLQEYNNPLPRWWLYLFWATLIFGVVYFVLYPSLGNLPGKAGWTSANQYDAEVKKAEERYAPLFARFEKQDLAELAKDPEAQATGQRLFLNYCAQCHGADGQGSKGFPNLTDADWLYGGEPATIKTTILGGRQGVMPALGAAIGSDGTKDVANYVRSLSGLANDSLRAARGREIFAANCVACHGPEGKGNPALGAPNLTDKTWLYGSSEATIVETVTKGRQNQMPAFKDLVGESRVHVLAAYVLSIKKQ